MAEPASLCPNCRAGLKNVVSRDGSYFACGSCQGKLIGVGLLKTVRHPEAVQGLWVEAKRLNRPVGKRCPTCQKAMLAVTSPPEDGAIEVDACPRCYMIWLDQDELEKIRARSRKEIEREREGEAKREFKKREEHHQAIAKASTARNRSLGYYEADGFWDFLTDVLD